MGGAGSLQTVEPPCNMATFIVCTLEDYAVHGETLEWTIFINRDPYANFHPLINSFRLNGSYTCSSLLMLYPQIGSDYSIYPYKAGLT